MKIGPIRLENPTILAPLAGITNLPFRIIAREAGCGMFCSEMISANGLVHRSQKTLRMLDSVPEEKPLSVQIFGADPDIMADAAAMVAASGADILDINFGCSVHKVVKTGAGVALMREFELTSTLLSAVRRAVSIPITIKVRSGWDASGQEAVRICKIAEECGVDAVAVHPRTARQGFRGRADWRVIKSVRQAVGIPVVGNGDILTPDDAMAMMAETGCDGIMVGRAAIGNPAIFSLIVARFKNRETPVVDTKQRLAVMRRYLAASIDYLGEFHACRMMRSRLGWFSKGLPCSSRFRESIKQISTEADAVAAIDRFEELLSKHRPVTEEKPVSDQSCP